tara:strand:- start:74 stop:826 length:753 start_codon:yes stop_codon:yes gene_type:complete
MQELVVGCNIKALRYAFVHGCPLVYVKPRIPHRFTGNTEEWHHLYYCLSLAGLIRYGNQASQIRISEDGLRVTEGQRAHTVVSESYLIFDDEGVIGLPPPVNKNKMVEVLDWIDVRSGMKHDLYQMHVYDSFIKSINFYPSDRIDGNHKLKDVCVVSHLTESQLQDFKFSELITRIKAEEVMKEAGVKGTGNGVGKYLSLRLESNRREVYPLEMSQYDDLPAGFSVSGIDVGRHPHSKEKYLNYLIKGVR